MNFSETEFMFFLFSFVFIYRVISLSPEKLVRQLLFVWLSTITLGVLVGILITRFGYQSQLFQTSLVGFGSLNILFYVCFLTLEKTLEDLGLGRIMILFFTFTFLLFPLLLFPKPKFDIFPFEYMDRVGIMPLFIATGLGVWFFEMFWKDRFDNRSHNVPYGYQILLLLLPIGFLILSPLRSEVDFFTLAFEYFLFGLFSSFGFLIVSHIKEEVSDTSFEVGAWIGMVSLSGCLGEDLLVLLPLSFLLGVFGRLFLGFLSQTGWSRRGSEKFTSFFLPSLLGVFLPLLIVPREKWPHSPFVLLAVQAIFFLSVLILTAVFVSFVLLLRREAETKKQ